MEWNQGNYEYMQTLDEADMEHQRFLEEAQAEQARQLLEENQGRIEGLQGARDQLEGLRGERAEAKAKLDTYVIGTTVDINGVDTVVTEEMFIFADDMYYDLDLQVKELERKVKEVEGLKQAVDEAA